MNKNNYQIAVDRALDNKASEVLLIPANKTEPVRLQAQPGATYTLSDKATDKAPQQIFARRQGKNLHVQLDVQRPGEAPDLIIENFYEGAPGHIVGTAEDSSTYRFVPNTAQEFDQLSLMADGASASQVLGGAVFVGAPAAPLAVAAAPLVAVGGFALGPMGMAVAGLGGALALAGGGGGGGGGGSTSGGGSSTPLGFSAGILPSDDTGVSSTDGITRKTQPKFEGSTIPGAKVQLTLDNGDPATVIADDSGRWSWTPLTALSPGAHTLSASSVDARGNPVTKVVNLRVDTSNITAELSSNFNELNSEPLGAKDDKLNINESKNGVVMSIVLDDTPGRILTVNDLNLASGTIRANSFTQDAANPRKYTFLADPTPATSSNLVLSWSPTGRALTDVAGNLLENAATQQLSLPYDTAAPQATIFAGSKSVELTANQNLAIPWTSTNVADITRIDVNLLGQTASKTSNFSAVSLVAAGNGLDKLIEGYYTLTTNWYDAAGNTSSQQVVLAVNRATLPADAWNTTTTNPPAGTTDNNLFINRAGNQSFTGGGGSDTFVWLKRDAAPPGSPDTDTITDFRLLSDGQGDKLDIKDLLGANIAFANLSKYLHVATFDADGNNTADSTRVSISKAGAFESGANVAGLSDQVILLQGVATDLNSLLGNNLIWEATGAPVLA